MRGKVSKNTQRRLRLSPKPGSGGYLKYLLYINLLQDYILCKRPSCLNMGLYTRGTAIKQKPPEHVFRRLAILLYQPMLAVGLFICDNKLPNEA
jgi:hypothetical protein